MKKRNEMALVSIILGTLALTAFFLHIGMNIGVYGYLMLLLPIVLGVVADTPAVYARIRVTVATGFIYIGAGMLGMMTIVQIGYFPVRSAFALYGVLLVLTGWLLMKELIRSLPQMRDLKRGLKAVLWDVTSTSTWTHGITFYLLGGLISLCGALFSEWVMISGSYTLFMALGIFLLVWMWYVDMALSKAKQGMRV